ncbi:TOPRS ligase, partial [Pachycephala philippinensis]|nr:TOPRS ligase [Pachycephala philippinensis]
MARENYGNCPICKDTPKDVASALPCDHRFCLGCILRWTQINPSCPLCSTPVETVRFSERGEQDCLLFAVISPEESPETNSHAEAGPILLGENSPHGPLVSPASSPQGILSPAEQGAARPEPVGGLLPKVWARLFRQRQHLLDPVRPWLRERLEGIFQDQWWLVQVAQSSTLHDLCLHGLNVEHLVLTLQNCLGEHTAALVHGLINVIVGQCREEAQRLLLFDTGREETDSLVASTSSSSMSSSSRFSSSWERISASVPAGLNIEEEAGISEAALQGGPSHCPPVPIPAERDQPQEEPEQAAVAGPSAQGSVCSPSAPGQGRDQSHREPRRARKRRAPSPWDSPPPNKRPRQTPA